MKKKLACILATVMLLAAFSLAVSADFSYVTLDTEYTVYTASEIAYSYSGETAATVNPRGGGSLSCLIDGNASTEVTNHDQAGIVLVCNDYVKPAYEVNMSRDDQPLDAIPTFSFTLSYDDEVTFDAVYLSLFYQMFDCVSAPGEHKVVVETSDDGSVWVPVGEDGAHYFRDNQPEYSGVADPVVEEIMVALGEEVTAQYVRLTFTFKQLSAAETYWTYYTNVYEWCGFTELGVASYESGEEISVIDRSYAEAEAMTFSGAWYAEEDGVGLKYAFGETEDGTKSVTVSIIDVATGEVAIEATVPYIAGVDTLTLVYEDYTEVYRASYEEDVLILEYDGEELVLDPYVEDEPVVSGDESAEESSAVEESSADETSSETETSSEEGNAAVSVTSSAASTSSSVSDDDGGISTAVIVAIVIATVVIVAVIVVIILKKKK